MWIRLQVSNLSWMMESFRDWPFVPCARNLLSGKLETLKKCLFMSVMEQLNDDIKFGIKLYSEWFRWFWYWVFEIKMILMILILKFGNQNDFWNFDFTLSKIKMIFMILTMDFSFSKSWQWFWQLIFSKVMILTNNDFAEKWNHTNPE